MTHTVAEILTEVQKVMPFGSSINTAQETKPSKKKAEKSPINTKKGTRRDPNEENSSKDESASSSDSDDEEAPLNKIQKANPHSKNTESKVGEKNRNEEKISTEESALPTQANAGASPKANEESPLGPSGNPGSSNIEPISTTVEKPLPGNKASSKEIVPDEEKISKEEIVPEADTGASPKIDKPPSANGK